VPVEPVALARCGEPVAGVVVKPCPHAVNILDDAVSVKNLDA
jgi:hypothetical protein